MFEPYRRWFVWLYMVATPDETKNYLYTVCMKSSEFNEEMIYKGQPISLLIKREEIYTTGRCLSLDDVVAKRFCTNECLTISFSIHRNQTIKQSKSFVFSPAFSQAY